MAIQTAEQYGFWALLVIMLVRDMVIPLANKIIPAKVKSNISLEERAVIAMENGNKVSTSMIEIMRQTSSDHKSILEALTRQGEILAVLMDRERIKRTPKK